MRRSGRDETKKEAGKYRRSDQEREQKDLQRISTRNVKLKWKSEKRNCYKSPRWIRMREDLTTDSERKAKGKLSQKKGESGNSQEISSTI
jgi:hypothetical protein